MDLSVIIVNWKSADYLKSCLVSLRQALEGVAAEVLVIDNASFDDSAEVVRKEGGNSVFLQSERNLGFAGANNSAARSAVGRLLLFLNPDTEVEPDALRRLIAVFEEPYAAGLAGPRVLNRDRTVQTSCVQAFPTVINQVLDSEFLRRHWPDASLWGTAALTRGDTEPSVVEAVAGSCLMIRRDLFEELNGFDTRYFMYGEDLDLCYRAGQRGWSCYTVPDACIVHYGGGSSVSMGSAFSIVTMRQSVYQFMRYHYGAGRALVYRIGLGLSALVRIPAALLTWPVRGERSGRTVRKWSWIVWWSLGWTHAQARRR